MRLEPLPPTELPPALVREAALELGEVPLALAALARAPEPLLAAWSYLREALLRGRLSRTTKELLALASLSVAGAGAFARVFQAALARRGVDPLVLEDLLARGESQRLPERTQLLLQIGRKAALQPGLLGEGDWGRLRKEGLDAAEQAELLLAAGAVALLVNLSRAVDPAPDR